MSIQADLVTAQRYLQTAINDLSRAPDKTAMAEIFQLLQRLDDDYKRWCDEYDEQYGDGAVGLTYDEGISIEYYIEATDMHDLSKLLRKIVKKEK